MSAEIGKPFPDFALPNQDGKTLKLGDFAGKWLVVYVYPKDDTPGCTTENLGFSAAKADFDAAGVTLVGVSKDPVAKHGKFRAKHGLTVELGSAADDDMVERYGAWVEKSLYGRQYMGIDRSTWLIDGEGVIRQIWRKVKVPGHVAAVLEAVRNA